MKTYYTPCPVLDTSPKPMQSGQCPAHTHWATITPSCDFRQSPSPDQLKQTLFCSNGERGVFLNPESFHIVDFIKALTSSLSIGTKKVLERSGNQTHNRTTKHPFFSQGKYEGVGKSKEAGKKQRVGPGESRPKGWREGSVMAAHGMTHRVR